MIDAMDVATFVGFAALVLLIIIVVLGLLFSRPKTTVERPRKASLPPLHGVYRPSEGGRGHLHPTSPPEPSEGSAGGSS
jgi:hypothetical protein